jgi:hypothetical protein
MVTHVRIANAMDGGPTDAGSLAPPGRLTPVVEHTYTSDRTPVVAIRISLGFALLWALLAAVRPGTTFHLAPLLVAAAVPWVHRVQDRPARPAAYRLAAVGTGIAAGTSVLLAIAGRLDGPTLLPFGGALEESLVGAVIGGLAGLAVLAGPRRMRVD